MLSYNAAGGDGYPVVTKNPTFLNTGFIDAEVLAKYIWKHSQKGVIDASSYDPKD